jgi:hypothetical protein
MFIFKVTETMETHRKETLELQTKLEAVNEELSIMCQFKDKVCSVTKH